MSDAGDIDDRMDDDIGSLDDFAEEGLEDDEMDVEFGP